MTDYETHNAIDIRQTEIRMGVCHKALPRALVPRLVLALWLCLRALCILNK